MLICRGDGGGAEDTGVPGPERGSRPSRSEDDTADDPAQDPVQDPVLDPVVDTVLGDRPRLLIWRMITNLLYLIKKN